MNNHSDGLPPYLPVAACVVRHVYRLRSRNLIAGVFDGSTGFIGIREKMGRIYLFTEYHADTNGEFGTVMPYESIGIVPDGIELVTRFPQYDARTGRPVAFDAPVAAGGRGWYFIDTGEADQAIEPKSDENTALFDFLAEIEAGLPES